ncbi:hypothetical protein SAMN05444365_101933 [Micromonospora pattaloongensis]|uniref:Lipoprotein n=1 Tax=Micromonospora pattaloongensis TaxID=405436 RepID=A0A1H3HRH6_9ACTN|nr:hypothetical protein [Micromonospora pattaloongensis]SDY17398.1 hypothetical protein SAMN05444365_101933 [Micromonospora pattaloongensis]
MSRTPAPAALAALLAWAALLVGCGTPPELRDGPGGAAPSPTGGATATPSPTPSAPPIVIPTPTATTAAPGFNDTTAVDCRRRPDGAQIVALLRRTPGLLPTNARVTVRQGPLCARDWQYTVLVVPGREPLQVVTSGTPTALTLVAAGTDVCGIPVRVTAPPGIRALACDATSASGPGYVG